MTLPEITTETTLDVVGSGLKRSEKVSLRLTLMR
jgi:hypothetical protein